MERDEIVFWRNVFYRAFAIGVAVAIFFGILTFALWDVWMLKVTQWFKLGEEECSKIVLQFFVQVRIVVVFFFLVPALALHWTARTKK